MWLSTSPLLHWMFEAQDSDVIGKLLKLSYVQVDTKLVSNVTPFDSFVLGYCVAHSNCKWIIYTGTPILEMME